MVSNVMSACMKIVGVYLVKHVVRTVYIYR